MIARGLEGWAWAEHQASKIVRAVQSAGVEMGGNRMRVIGVVQEQAWALVAKG
jgi:hypothetical protein